MCLRMEGLELKTNPERHNVKDKDDTAKETPTSADSAASFREQPVKATMAGRLRSMRRKILGRTKVKLHSANSNGSQKNQPNDHLQNKRMSESLPRAQALVRTRIEPKTFFANERTFLQWLNIAVLVMLTSLSLLGGTTVSRSVMPSGSSGSCAPHDSACKATKVAKSYLMIGFNL